MHPRDADERGVVDGQHVRVVDDRGQYVALAEVSAAIAPGVVLSPMGAWRKDTRGGATVSAVSAFAFADLGNAPTSSDTRVEVEAV